MSFKTAAIAALLVATYSPAIAATVSGGSDLMTAARANLLEGWLVSDPTLSYSGNLVFTNIFDKGEGDTSTTFHTAVDGKGPTIVLMEAWDSNASEPAVNIIGGFNPHSWSSYGSYNYTFSTGEANRTAFIFNLTDAGSPVRQEQEAISTSGVYQTYNKLDYGPTFGAGHDIQISGLSNGYAMLYSYCDNPNADCHYTSDPNILGNAGRTYLTYGAIEVYTISSPTEVPVPASVLMLLAGLGGLAALRRRG